MKPINSHTSNEFHDWQRRVFNGRGLSFQDVDAWALSVSDAEHDFRPLALLELKRSFIAVDAWRPFPDDRPSYAGLLGLARAAGIPLFVVYFRKGVAIEDGTPLAVFRLEATHPGYRAYRKVLAAREFAARFPDLTGAP